MLLFHLLSALPPGLQDARSNLGILHPHCPKRLSLASLAFFSFFYKTSNTCFPSDGLVPDPLRPRLCQREAGRLHLSPARERCAAFTGFLNPQTAEPNCLRRIPGNHTRLLNSGRQKLWCIPRLGKNNRCAENRVCSLNRLTSSA